MIRTDNRGIFYNDKVEGVKETLVQMGRFSHAMYYEPTAPIKSSHIGVLIMHSDANYMSLNMAPQLARQGYHVLACESIEGGDIDRKFSIVNIGMNFLHSLTEVKKVVLMGHSGGATLMTAYQSIAENGVEVYQGDEKIYKCQVREKLTAADALMLIDANYGNGPMTLISLDPAVVEEGNGTRLDPEYDIFSPANGYSPDGAHYSEAFISKYHKAQERRNAKLIKLALERLHAIEQGKGLYIDDEPFIITAGNQPKPNNRLIPEDLHFLSHTKGEYDLLHGDGSITNEIIHCLRTPEIDRSMSSLYGMGANKTTVRGFLSAQAIATNGFSILEDDMVGIDWHSSYSSAIGNIEDINCPLLVMGMTGSYEYLASEMIYNHAKMKDKTIIFVRGASHMFSPNHAAQKTKGEFGNTEMAIYNYMGEWMKKLNN
jgi:pimeloyl-ACP methyl ester carboxylesterase